MASLRSSSASYAVGEAKEGATQFARDVGDEVLSDPGVEYQVTGFLDNKGEKILDAAEEYGCDHVVITGRQRSPTGKALVGDAAQKVVFDFDHPVIVLTDRLPYSSTIFPTTSEILAN